jgi:hypothetical protein
MRETRLSGLEGGAARSTCRSYPYLGGTLNSRTMERDGWESLILGGEWDEEGVNGRGKSWGLNVERRTLNAEL